MVNRWVNCAGSAFCFYPDLGQESRLFPDYSFRSGRIELVRGPLRFRRCPTKHVAPLTFTNASQRDVISSLLVLWPPFSPPRLPPRPPLSPPPPPLPPPPPPRPPPAPRRRPGGPPPRRAPPASPPTPHAYAYGNA